jgi:hypothetical protein
MDSVQAHVKELQLCTFVDCRRFKQIFIYIGRKRSYPKTKCMKMSYF